MKKRHHHRRRVRRKSSIGERRVTRHVRRAVHKGRRNYKASSGGRGVGAEIAEGLSAFAGGAAYPLATATLMKGANMIFPQDAEGTGGAPRALVGTVAAVGLHIGSRMILGGVAPRVAQAIGHGAYGALGADVGVQLLKAVGVGDYISATPGMHDYISAGRLKRAPHLGDRKTVSLLAGVGRTTVPHLGDQAPRPRASSASRRQMNDVSYGAGYGANYG